jgi:hypothetical protein
MGMGKVLVASGWRLVTRTVVELLQWQYGSRLWSAEQQEVVDSAGLLNSFMEVVNTSRGDLT